jgi:uncharacterized membrane protein
VTRGGAAGVLAVGAEAAGTRLRGRIPDWASPSGRPFAAAVALVFATKAVRRSRRDGGSFAGPVRSLIGGGCVSVGLIAIGRAERAVSRRVAAAVGRVMPPGPAGTAAAAVAGRATVLAGALWITQRRIHRSALAAQDREGRLDPSQPEPPVGTSVSGSASSSIPYDTVAQQGSRFLHGATPPAAIARVAGTCRAEPVRVYVGLQSARAPGERV